HGRVTPSRLDWRKTGGPWFGNQLMTLTLRGRSARLRLDQAQPDPSGGGARLVTALEADWPEG
ncbi:alkaline phosphatase family protein, partial [Streptomyces sp. 2MCAF27]